MLDDLTRDMIYEELKRLMKAASRSEAIQPAEQRNILQEELQFVVSAKEHQYQTFRMCSDLLYVKINAVNLTS